MSDEEIRRRWQEFFDSWAVRALTFDWRETKLCAFATRGLTDESPKWRRWARVLIVALVFSLVMGLLVAWEKVILRLAVHGF